MINYLIRFSTENNPLRKTQNMLDAQSHKPLPKQNEIRTNESQGVVEIAINFSGLAENILQ